LVVGVLVTLGVFGVLALVGGSLWVGWKWQRIQANLRAAAKAGPKEVHVAGCDHAYLYEPSGLDGGAKGTPHYTLYCLGKLSTATMPTCNDVIARYVAANGPLPTDVRVTVRRGAHDPVCPCDGMYAGDGTPK
jgi:hypothetical protein